MGFQIVGTCPEIHGIATESKDYIVELAKTGDDGPVGYVVKNKHTDVYEYVARSFPEVTTVMANLQDQLDGAAKSARPSILEAVKQ